MAWSIENNAIVGRVYDLASAAYLSGGDETRRGRYLNRVEAWLSRLDERVKSLEWPFALLPLTDMPRLASGMTLPHDVWVRTMLDSLQTRLVSVVDSALHVINVVLELNMMPSSVNHKRLRERVNALPEVTARLDELRDIQLTVRQKRNILIHQGREQRYGGADYSMLRAVSYFAAMGAADVDTANIPRRDGSGNYSLREGYERVAEEMRDEFQAPAEETVRAVDRLLDRLHDEFNRRWASMS